jgi:hypothetical protein
MSDRRRECGVQIAENIICKMKTIKKPEKKNIIIGIAPFASHKGVIY